MKSLCTILFCILFGLSSSVLRANEPVADYTQSQQVVTVTSGHDTQFSDMRHGAFYILDDTCRVFRSLLIQEPDYARLVERQNHLHGWTKFCHIYGKINLIAGAVFAALNANADSKVGTVSSLCMVAASLIVATRLSNQCSATRYEIQRYNAAKMPVSSFQWGESDWQPSVTLMADRQSHDATMGLGLTVRF